MTALSADVTVVGAGLTGMAVAYGLARRGLRVELLDARDPLAQLAPSVASLMAQERVLPGVGAAQLASLAVESWVSFDSELADIAGCYTQYRRDGGLFLCADEAALSARASRLANANEVAQQAPIEFEMLESSALHRLVPHLSSTTAGASYCADDARVNPHGLRRALALALNRLRVNYRPHQRVQWARPQGGEWVVMGQGLAVGCGRVVLACGANAEALVADQTSLAGVMSFPESVVQTQALVPFLPFACAQFNQAGDGSMHLLANGLGVNLDEDARAVRAQAAMFCPAIERLRVVKTWHGDRHGLADGTACFMPFSDANTGWLLAVPDSLFLSPVLAGIAADVVSGRVDARAFEAYHPAACNAATGSAPKRVHQQ